jgi:hypothetical protein
VVADFDGGELSSDGGGLLLREVEQHRGWIRAVADCFRDYRDPGLIEHTVLELSAQRVFGLALGYEDLNDHDQLRVDPLLAVVCGKPDPLGEQRRREIDQGKALAGKSTLNRLEHGQGATHRYKKIVCDEDKFAALFLEKFISRHTQAPTRLVLDLDATDDPLHGAQEGRFFHGYYGNYCYLPLYIFCGSELLLAKLRPANIDASAGSLEQVQRIVRALREAWPGVQIILRADSGFARDELMSWCEANGVDYLFGLSRNPRLEGMLAPAMGAVSRWCQMTGAPARAYMELHYQTLDTWSRSRRVVGKAEWLEKGENPRFVVTSLDASAHPARQLYEQDYCGRGDMENRIKEQQLDLFADRTSTATLKANQLRLWFSSVAYCLLNDLRELGLKGTRLAAAQCGTIRTRLMKIGAAITVSVRRVWIRMARSCPYQDVFAQAWKNLSALAAADT